jgi:hypothetical protein
MSSALPYCLNPSISTHQEIVMINQEKLKLEIDTIYR